MFIIELMNSLLGVRSLSVRGCLRNDWGVMIEWCSCTGNGGAKHRNFKVSGLKLTPTPTISMWKDHKEDKSESSLNHRLSPSMANHMYFLSLIYPLSHKLYFVCRPPETEKPTAVHLELFDNKIV